MFNTARLMAQERLGGLRARIVSRDKKDAWFGPRNRLPVSFVAEVDDPEKNVIVTLRIADGAGTKGPQPWHLRELSIKVRDPEHPLSVSELRTARLRRAIDLAVAAALMHVEKDATGDLVRTPETDRYAIAGAVDRYWRELITGKVGRPPLTPEQRAQVLDLHEELQGQRDWAAKIESLLGISRSTVYKVIRESNEEGGSGGEL